MDWETLYCPNPICTFYGVRFHKIGYDTPKSAKPEKFISAKFQK